MNALANFVEVEIWLFLWALAVAVGWRLLSGQISLAGLISSRASDPVSPFRVQQLLATLALAMILVGRVLTDRSRFPDIPEEFVALLGGSNILYVLKGVHRNLD